MSSGSGRQSLCRFIGLRAARRARSTSARHLCPSRAARRAWVWTVAAVPAATWLVALRRETRQRGGGLVGVGPSGGLCPSGGVGWLWRGLVIGTADRRTRRLGLGRQEQRRPLEFQAHSLRTAAALQPAQPKVVARDPVVVVQKGDVDGRS